MSSPGTLGPSVPALESKAELSEISQTSARLDLPQWSSRVVWPARLAWVPDTHSEMQTVPCALPDPPQGHHPGRVQRADLLLLTDSRRLQLRVPGGLYRGQNCTASGTSRLHYCLPHVRYLATEYTGDPLPDVSSTEGVPRAESSEAEGGDFPREAERVGNRDLFEASSGGSRTIQS